MDKNPQYFLRLQPQESKPGFRKGDVNKAASLCPYLLGIWDFREFIPEKWMAGPFSPLFLQNLWNFAVPNGDKQSQHSEFSHGHPKIPNFGAQKAPFFPQKPRERLGMCKQRGLGAGKNIPRARGRPKFQVWNENCSLGGSRGSQGNTGARLGWNSMKTFLPPIPRRIWDLRG